MDRLRYTLTGLLAVAVLAPPTAGAALYRCAMTGEVHAGVCCDGEHEEQPSVRGDVQPCCVLVARSDRPTTAAAETESRSLRVLMAAPSMVEAVAVAAPRARAAVLPSVSSRAPPSDRGLWLSTCSLLI